IDTVGGISPTQNHSANHVDFGVQADAIVSRYYQFKTPFQENIFISGSSYATAIAAGKIGAYLPIEFFSELPDINKGRLMEHLSGLRDIEGEPIVHKNDLFSAKIKNGRYIIK